MPLRREGMSLGKSFFYGQLSAVVEPIAGVIGVVAVSLAQPLLPYAHAFAAGAMIFVVVEELIPESQKGGYADLATMSLMVGRLRRHDDAGRRLRIATVRPVRARRASARGPAASVFARSFAEDRPAAQGGALRARAFSSLRPTPGSGG